MNKENKNASIVAGVSLGGRFLTFLGRTLYIGRFGTNNPLLNIFSFALQAPNVIFNVLWTALTSVMIPVYNSLLAEDRKDEAKKFIDNVISFSFIILALLTVFGLLAAPVISSLIEGSEFQNTEYLTFALRVFMPVIIFFGFGAIFTGLLQSHGSFKLPAFVSAPGGIFLIIYLVFLSDRFGVTGLIFATVLGALSQPLILIPAVWKLGYRYKFSLDFKDKNLRLAAKLSIPVLISSISYQVHFIFGHSIALRLGITAIMDYSQQLVQVFILTIVYAIAAVYFPKLSQLWAKKDTIGFNENLQKSLLFTFFLALPGSLGMFLLRFEIMEFLLSLGGNGDSDIYLAGNLMGIYSIGVIAISFKEVYDRAFYSFKDSKTPALFGVLIMITNVLAVISLIPFIGAYAMPVAYGVSASVGGIGLFIKLYVKIRFVNFYFILEVVKTLAAALVMVFAALAGRSFLLFEINILNLIVPAVFGAAGYFTASYFLKISALKNVRRRA